MNKLIPIVLILIAACSQPQQEKAQTDIPRDSLPEKKDSIGDLNTAVDFDLLVRNYEDPDRKSWQNPELVIGKLGDLADKTIADIGAGTGYFTFRLAPLAKRVIAIDIDQRFLSYIEDKRDEMPEALHQKIELRHTEPDNPQLQDAEADIVLLVNTYSFINNRITYLKKVKKGIKAGGKLVILDYKEGNLPVGPLDENKLPASTVTDELMKAGFGDVNIDYTSLQYQYIITAQ